ncbi:MAG: flagellin [Phycisphaerae bacterium]|nr:flagellin [Phycisphaerae bacterium]
MSRINTNISSLQAIHRLVANQDDLSTRLERLSSGLRINRGKDDPAGLIASQSLRSELRGIGQAIENSSRAINVIATADAALSEVSALLLEVRGLINKSANEGALSDAEIQANQLQIDSLLESIDRIANTTQFNGKKLLNGELAYNLSGIDSGSLARAQIFGARVPAGSSLSVIVDVTQSAQTAQLNLAAGGGTGLSASGFLSSTNNVTIQIGGALGTETFSFSGGTVNSAIRDNINAFTSLTGVSASLSGQSLVFHSTEYGSDAFVSVAPTTGNFTVSGGDVNATRDNGRDAGVQINGQAASVRGLSASIRTNGLDLALDLSESFGTAVGSTSFEITGGGAQFQIGPTVNADGLVSVGVASVNTTNLGSATAGYLNTIKTGQANAIVSGNYTAAERIVNAAIEQIAVLSGRLGGFQANQLETNINSRQIAYENVQASESAIRDTDYASEVARLTRAQILVQATTQILSIANAAPQNVLALLR